MGVNEDNGKRDMKDGPTKKPFIYYYFLVILIVMILNALVFPMMEHTVEVPYSEFITQLDAGNVKDVYMSKLDERINNRKNKKINKYKKLRHFKILSVIFMINITIGCIFFTDYNMNKMLNRESTINKGIEFIQKNINCIEKILRNIDLNIKI